MAEKDDVFENWIAMSTEKIRQASLEEQEALRQEGDPKRLSLDKILAMEWGHEFDQTGELDLPPIEDQFHRAIAAE